MKLDQADKELLIGMVFLFSMIAAIVIAVVVISAYLNRGCA